MKEKFSFVYDQVTSAILALNQKKITVEHAKATASLLKQANNILVLQLDAAKFLANLKDAAREEIINVGLEDGAKD